ncbi:DMT family transporter [Acinetobacter rathckeae]|uniref:DMT family transporter n=1 Tax=Acinetobacter rathckeae TaxID=2605272 RepID=UPI0018A2C8E6|nr:DMT family transporter [Acinetobacter rathckeae]MBF7687352.1 DMT family transporter [Acinetobacter rathckeae]MBF7694753.1 DMT family transporter [Acinetobacter rathckeae]
MKKIKNGWINGLIGVCIFAGSLPATRIAVQDFPPVFLTSIRASIATLFAIILLIIFKPPRPQRSHLLSLIISAVGVIIGFPLLTALALMYVTSAHSIVFVGLLPMSTAIFAVIRGGEKPKPLFWIFSLIGALSVAGYSALDSTGSSLIGDLLMLLAVIVCGLGYADGARLSRTLGGWQVISWSLLVSFPIVLPIALVTMPTSFQYVSTSAWFSLAYVSIFSMLLGFIFWYRGLAQGGIAAVGQLQLFQPFMGLALASVLLHESISWTMLIATLVAVVCVAGAKEYAK